MALSNNTNVTKRIDVNRRLTFGEMDENFEQLKLVITDAGNLEIQLGDKVSQTVYDSKIADVDQSILDLENALIGAVSQQFVSDLESRITVNENGILALEGGIADIINDVTISNDSTWSSLKTSSEIDSVIKDTVTETGSTWSSNKINTAITDVIDDTVTETGSTWSSQKTASEIEASGTKGTLSQSFLQGQQETITLSTPQNDEAIVSVIKEVPQTGATTDNWDINTKGSNYDIEDTAYATSLTPSGTTGEITLTLGSGNFVADDIGKTISGNGGAAVLQAADGSAIVTIDFNDTGTIFNGDWKMEGVAFDNNSVMISHYIDDFNLPNASYDSVSFSISGQDTDPSGIAFSADGTKMFMVGNSDIVYQYSLTTAFDLSTASYDSVSFSVGGQDTNPTSIAFSNDGTKMFMVGTSSSSVHQYSLTTAFDLSTASYDPVSFSLGGTPYSIAFNNDGTKMFMVIVGFSGSVHQYSLTTAFDLSTASYDSVSFSVGGQDDDPTSIAFNNYGTKMFIIGTSSSESVHQYSLTTAFDLSTASYDSVSFSVGGQDGNPTSIAFNNYGTKMFILGNFSDAVFQYTTGAIYTYDSAFSSVITNVSGQIDSTFWTDINSATSIENPNNQTVSYSFSTDDKTTFQIVKNGLGARNIVRDNAGTWEVNTNSIYSNETWAAAADNTIWGAFSEAMTVASENMMPPEQLANTNANDFPAIGDTLDLAITLYTSKSNEIPSSQGVTLNYDANILNQGAINGTDYEWEQPTDTEVRIKALKSNNLKVRVV